MPPKVSVNICCYNSEKFIKQTIQSVIGQTYDDLEVIVIDDGSKDRTGEIVRSFSDPRIKYHFQENRGLSASRNRAIELSQGEYIALLDHDDLWYPEKLEQQMPLLELNPTLGMVYSDAVFIDEKGEVSSCQRFFDINRPHRGKVTKQLVNADFIPCLTAVFRKKHFNETGPFNEQYKIAEEYDFFLRLSLISDIDYIDKPLAKYRIHAGNASADNERMHKEECKLLASLMDKTTDLSIKHAIEERIAKNRKILVIIAMSKYLPKWFAGSIMSTLKYINRLIKRYKAGR